MRLPAEIEQRVLELINMPDLNWKSARVHNKKINRIRNQMYKLAEDFAQTIPSADLYSDAYFAYNFPMNFVKAMVIAKEVNFLYPQLFNNKDTIRILDIGCGEGAGMLGFYYGIKNSTKFVLTGIDTSTQMLKKCKNMTHSLKNRDTCIRIKLRRQDVSHGLLKKKTHKYNIVIFANSLAEMFTGNNIPVKFIERILKSTDDDGVIIIIEPATKYLSRRLMNLRNEIIRKHKAYVLLPCFHKNECPLMDIRKQKEWCHQSISWHPPDFMKILNQGLNREINYLKFSYLVISKKEHKRNIDESFLVLSHLLKEKGKKKCFLCTPTGRVELVRLNKLKTQANREFDRISKGDIISFTNVVQTNPHYWQITEDTQIRILVSKNI
ncbi:methyltransferase domain-containing protein [candidate division WOR-3 bacterium]|nr:methyltransferase domain-containing protein [candidate division WOR-3 bacterium]